jgi:hypothetical protein
MAMIFKNISLRLVDELFHEFLDTDKEHLRFAMEKSTYNRVEPEVFLNAPDFLFKLYDRAQLEMYGQKPMNLGPESHRFWRGGKVVFQPHFEMEMVLFHKDYPLYLYETMIQRQKIDMSKLVDGDTLSVTVIPYDPKGFK